MPACHQLILCTCPDQESAEKIAHHLIAGNLAACVNILPGIRSIYSWQGRIESAQEQLLLIKANKDYYAAIESTIIACHPYELPEIIAVAIENGLPGYLNWIDLCHASK